MFEGDALTAWLLLKAPLFVALIYSYQLVKGDLNAIMITVFFFPYVFLMLRNLWLEILHHELLQKLKFDSGLETDVIKKLFMITRFLIVILAIIELYLIPQLMNLPSRPTLSDIPLMILTTIVLILTPALFLWQIRFRVHTGRLLHVVETGKKFDQLKELDNDYRIKFLNPAAFAKYHARIKKVLK